MKTTREAHGDLRSWRKQACDSKKGHGDLACVSERLNNRGTEVLDMGTDGQRGFLEQVLGTVRLLGPKFWVRGKSREGTVSRLGRKEFENWPKDKK